MSVLLNPQVLQHAAAILVGIAVLAALVGAVVWVIRMAISFQKWVEAATAATKKALEDFTARIDLRFREMEKHTDDALARHVEDERVWQRDVWDGVNETRSGISEVKERLARIEGELAAARDERLRRASHDRRMEE